MTVDATGTLILYKSMANCAGPSPIKLSPMKRVGFQNFRGNDIFPAMTFKFGDGHEKSA
jgi:hypothetical protein